MQVQGGPEDTAASSGIHFPRFGAWPGPDLTGGQAGHLATAWPPATRQPSPQLLWAALGGSRDPQTSTTSEGLGTELCWVPDPVAKLD